MSVALAAGISSIGGIASSILGGNSQVKAAEKAAEAMLEATEKNIEFQKWLYEDTKSMNKPWYDAGVGALSQMQDGIANGDFDIGEFLISDEYDPGVFAPNVVDPGTFNFDASKVQLDPAFKRRLDTGIQALDRSAASRGMLQSGAQQKAITNYAQDLLSDEYANAYDRAYQEQAANYGSAVDRYGRQYGSQLDRYNSQANRAGVLAGLGLTQYQSRADRKRNNFNMLAGLSGSGQGAAGANQSAAANMGQSVGNSYLQQGNALANNYLQQGNARANMYGGIASSVNQGIQNYLLSDYLKSNGQRALPHSSLADLPES
ncbi:hypothetical protein OO006_04335 [Prosthecochloris sp. SCSIO W1101]|uniref:hypothetical protein n=1 Tax=Prosthecochloris sp. SCSIO W1101 TaxID=2992242 RepID=UPI00223D9364|nr:hypothetical protein [Prosthecochloris sp. SCSIO W1101]UZJ42209.1 hypothetical protein OO006_04335 [Prosthecochloris sp. SCSIO W1101]